MMFMKGIAALVVAIAPVTAFVPGGSFGIRQPLTINKVGNKCVLNNGSLLEMMLDTSFVLVICS